jgi:hypothetical protein
MSSNRSPLADAIALIAEAQMTERPSFGTASPLIVSYCDDFSFLWSLEGGAGAEISEGGLGRAFLTRLTEPGRGHTPLILVWSSTPSQGFDNRDFNVVDWTTPYDWLVAAGNRLRHYGLPAALRVIIIDACSYRHPSSFGVQFFNSFQPTSDWLRIVHLAPGTERFERSQDCLQGVLPPVEHLIEALRMNHDQRGPTDSEAIRTEAQLQVVLRVWKQGALAPVHRHAVSNLIGPALLSSHLLRSGWPNAESIALAQSPPNQAFRRLLDELFSEASLASTSAPASYGATRTSPLVASRICRDRFGTFGKGVRFLLVDDHARVGFDEVIRCLLGGIPAGTPRTKRNSVLGVHSLEAHETTDRLLAWLLSRAKGTSSVAGAAAEHCEKCGSDMPEREQGLAWSEGSPASVADVLILDLRLFGDTEVGRADEMTFLRGLIAYYHCVGLCCSDGPNGPLMRAVAIAAEAAVRRLERLEGVQQERRDGTDAQHVSELAHLTLLPLLIHHADPALPIVVFSSTQQRQVLELLACSEAIITTCHKPSITGYEDTCSLDDACFSFLDAIDTALRLLELRAGWDEGRRLRLGSPPKCHVKDWKSPTGALQGASTRLVYKPTSWRTDDVQCQRMLERWYRDYALTGRWHDFLSVPWEFVEGSLIHAHYVEEPNPGISGFGVDISERALLARALEFCRHRKTHGYALTSSPATEDAQQAAGLCMWLVALDFLGGRARTHTSDMNHAAVKVFGDLTTLLAHRHLAIREGLEAGRITWPTGAQPLVALGGVSTPEFVMGAITEAISCKGGHANPWIRAETLKAVVAVVRGFAEACDEPLAIQGHPSKGAGGWCLESKLGRYLLEEADTGAQSLMGSRFFGAWSEQQAAWMATRK